MRRFLFFLIVPLFLFSTKPALASVWYFPMDKYFERQTVKGFGQLIDDTFYKGKENLFPFNRFYGYHAAVDLETYAFEKNEKTPVFAIHSGTITYIGSLEGYGGVILERLDEENATALYGHVKISNLPVKIGDHIVVDKPFVLTYLGDEFSSETSRERKHLHFAVHKGTDLYFHGHEQSLKVLNDQWFDPNGFLKERNAKSPIESPNMISKEEKKTLQNFLITFFNWLLSLFKPK